MSRLPQGRARSVEARSGRWSRGPSVRLAPRAPRGKACASRRAAARDARCPPGGCRVRSVRRGERVVDPEPLSTGRRDGAGQLRAGTTHPPKARLAVRGAAASVGPARQGAVPGPRRLTLQLRPHTSSFLKVTPLAMPTDGIGPRALITTDAPTPNRLARSPELANVAFDPDPRAGRPAFTVRWIAPAPPRAPARSPPRSAARCRRRARPAACCPRGARARRSGRRRGRGRSRACRG